MRLSKQRRDDSACERQRFLAACEAAQAELQTLDTSAKETDPDTAEIFEVHQTMLCEEETPALGYRAIRICLDRLDLFRTQLRALLSASIYGKRSISPGSITKVCKAVLESDAAPKRENR